LFTGIGSTTSYAQAVAVDEDNDIIFAGGAGSTTDSAFMVLEWNTALDQADVVFFPPDSVCDNDAAVGAAAHAVEVDSSGKLVVAGVCLPAGDTEATTPTMVVFRLDDTVDTTFGDGTGAVFVYNPEAASGEIQALDLEIDSDGYYVVTGYYTADDGNRDMILVRLKP
jgi:hypothetical protein